MLDRRHPLIFVELTFQNSKLLIPYIPLPETTVLTV